jgi:hypothetical protein
MELIGISEPYRDEKLSMLKNNIPRFEKVSERLFPLVIFLQTKQYSI